MLDECNFKSKVHIGGKSCCNLTPANVTCAGEDNCVLFQIYKNV